LAGAASFWLAAMYLIIISPRTDMRPCSRSARCKGLISARICAFDVGACSLYVSSSPKVNPESLALREWTDEQTSPKALPGDGNLPLQTRQVEKGSRARLPTLLKCHIQQLDLSMPL
jgi:hypothetical protein